MDLLTRKGEVIDATGAPAGLTDVAVEGGLHPGALPGCVLRRAA